MRARSARHDVTRDEILKAARSLVVKNGYDQLSLRQVAREAGFSPASLYEYFDSKDRIVAALARQASASLKLALDRRAKESRSARAQLVGVGIAYIAWAKEHAEDFLLLYDRVPPSRSSVEDAPVAAAAYQSLVEVVQRAHEAGAVKTKGSESVERLAYGLWAAAHGMAMLQLTHLSTFDADFAAADRSVLEALVDAWTL